MAIPRLCLCPGKKSPCPSPAFVCALASARAPFLPSSAFSLSFFVIFNTSPLFFSRPRPCPALSDPCATLSLSGLGWLTAVAESTKAFLATARASALPCRTLHAAAR